MECGTDREWIVLYSVMSELLVPAKEKVACTSQE